MKRKKGFAEESYSKSKKSKVEQTKSQKRKCVQPRLPKSAEDISANWKALSAVLAEKKKQQAQDDKTVARLDGKKQKYTKHNKLTRIHHTAELPSEKRKCSDEIWFDDVDPEEITRASGTMQERNKLSGRQTASTNRKGGQVQLISGGYEGAFKHLAMDCEMVGVGLDGEDHMLARVSIVNSHGHTVYDKYVAPVEKVIDYRTPVSGIRPANLRNAPSFKSVQQEVSDILKDKVLVGHSIKNDLKVLFLDHPRKSIRDTARYKPFQKKVKSKTPSLKKLAKEILGVDIHKGEHCSIQDAQVAMRLYCTHKKEWERNLKENHKFKGKKAKQST